MSKIHEVGVDDLLIWSDNPRNGFISSAPKMTETNAINLLIDVVGEKKMFNLAEDIVKSSGLNGNTFPVVVKEGKKYLVYDGNRRISSIKMLLNPSIIENDSLKRKIIHISEGVDLSFLNRVFVYATDEEEAFKLMDKTHNGEQDGVGVIAWDAFNRDISLVKRLQNPIYPRAYNIVKVLGWKRKKDFTIPYTDFQRLFSSKAVLEAFDIEKIDDDFKKNIEEAVAALIAFKQNRGFTSFSRYFNITESSQESDSFKPINDFIYWNKLRKDAESSYFITIDKTTIFTDSNYFLDYSKIHIRAKEDLSKEISFSPDDIQVQFINPIGKVQPTLNPLLGGKWTIRVFYRGISEIGEVLVITPKDVPEVSIAKNVRIKKGTSLPLKTLIKYAKSIHDNDMNVTDIVSVGEKQAIITSDVFSSKNDVGAYVISFVFDNDGQEHAETIEVTVETNRNQTENVPVLVPFEFDGNSSITFSNDVLELIKEINELWKSNNYRYVIICSARTVAELSFDFIYNKNSSIFNLNDQLSTKISNIADYLLNDNVLRSSFANKLKISYQSFSNELTNVRDNAEAISSTLNLGAHKSGARVDSNNLFEKIRVYLTRIVQIAECFK